MKIYLYLQKKNIKIIVSLEQLTYINTFNNLFSYCDGNIKKISRNVKMCKMCYDDRYHLGIIEGNNNKLYLMSMKNIQDFSKQKANKKYILSNVINFECSYHVLHEYSLIVLVK